MFLVPRIDIQLIYQSTNVLNKMRFITSIKLLHDSTPGCHSQGDIITK